MINKYGKIDPGIEKKTGQKSDNQNTYVTPKQD